jgi:hypothetical protein
MDIGNKGRFVMGMKLAAVTVASVVGLAASAYTNMHQLVNVRITPEVLAQIWKIYGWDDILEKGW